MAGDRYRIVLLRLSATAPSIRIVPSPSSAIAKLDPAPPSPAPVDGSEVTMVVGVAVASIVAVG
jgi:hypothetical protein